MFSVETDHQTGVVDLTDRVRDEVQADATGVVTVFVRHTTAGVILQEHESRLLEDLETILEDLVPDSGWRHDEIDDNREGRSPSDFTA